VQFLMESRLQKYPVLVIYFKMSFVVLHFIVQEFARLQPVVRSRNAEVTVFCGILN
jgi:hypothetical protein